MVQTLTIWDSSDACPYEDGPVLLWRSFPKDLSANVISAPALVEENAEKVRAEALSWLNEVAMLKLDGLPLGKALALDNKMNYWWQTLFAQKCNSTKSRRFNDIIKLIAIAGHFEECSVDAVRIVTKDPHLQIVFEDYAEANRLRLITDNTHSSLFRSLMSVADKLFSSRYVAFFWFVYHSARRLALTRAGIMAVKQQQNRPLFISILGSVSKHDLDAGRFFCPYWGALPDQLSGNKIGSTWLHLFDPTIAIPNAFLARRWIAKLNRIGVETRQAHLTLDSFWNVSVIIKAMRFWLRINKVAKRYEHLARKMRVGNVPAWGFIEGNWRSSFGGSCLRVSAYQSILLRAASESLWFVNAASYVQENQNWERAFLEIFSENTDIKTVGYPHAPLRFWDLRYSHDSLVLNEEKLEAPAPSLIVATGPSTQELLKKNGYDCSCIVPAYPLRYQKLKTVGLDFETASLAQTHRTRVLLLGSHDRRSNDCLLEIMSDVVEARADSLEVRVRSHPSTVMELNSLANYHVSHAKDSMDVELARADVVFAPCITSAGVDAYVLGANIVLIDDPELPNLSALRGEQGIRVVRDSQQVCEILDEGFGRWSRREERYEFFFFDQKMDNWLQFVTNEEKV